MIDLAIIGGGYWGTALALEARARGLEAVIYDDRQPEAASVNASAHFSFGWYKDEWKARAKAAYERAQQLGVVLRRTGALLSTPASRRQGKPAQAKADWHLFHPEQFLGLVEHARPVRPVRRVAAGLVEFEPWASSTEAVAVRTIAICAGVWTDNLLVRSGLQPLGVMGLAGTGVVFRSVGATAYSMPLLHGLNPFKQIAIREWGPGAIRVGETTEAKRGLQELYVKKMLQQVAGEVAGLVELRRYSGLRPMLEGGMAVRLVAPGIVVGTGGGRIGGLLSFWAAGEMLQQLGLA